MSAKTEQKTEWADMLEDDVPEEAGEAETKRLSDGTKLVIEYVVRDGEKFKITKRYRERTRQQKFFKAAEERQKNWVKFGKAVVNDPELTVIGEEQKLELGKKEEIKKNKIESDFASIISNATTAAQGGTGVYQAPTDRSKADAPGDAPGGDKKSGTYVAPGRGGGETDGSRPPRDDSCTVRITNLSEDISEDDLRQLFVKYGQISRSYVAVDKVTKERRGFAFITFKNREDAAMAIEKLDRHPFNHVILSVGWARPPQS
eukprot:TRINITY_DN51_c1_g2_i1.p1 TRINITY_DN51_c1_g2~~TRINITY_DN51_c1_g2_i1.p1  ORF type:complete len:260 (+),score=69.64 TRINITY_DN51_c1_g2_i1:47-826(+)